MLYMSTTANAVGVLREGEGVEVGKGSVENNVVGAEFLQGLVRDRAAQVQNVEQQVQNEYIQKAQKEIEEIKAEMVKMAGLGKKSCQIRWMSSREIGRQIRWTLESRDFCTTEEGTKPKYVRSFDPLKTKGLS
jgi:hypothetical protein